jgi:L-seryl-tRNA(Ser) seleniumtransferase
MTATTAPQHAGSVTEPALPSDGGTGSSLYARLGVAPFINASGHNTAQGGSLMPPEVLGAIQEAAQRYVSLRDLQDAAGRRIAEVIGAPAALVSAGAASAILLGAAAALTGADREKIYALPETPDGRNQVLVWRARRPNYMYQACQAAGGIVVEVGDYSQVSPEDFRAALSERTAAILLVLAPIDQARDRLGPWASFVGSVARYANEAGVPVLVDAASEVPPRALIRQLLDLGVAAAIVSGGKAIRGPQSTGILAGRPDLIAAAALNNNPLSGIGRPMKVGKEEIAGLVVAVERFFALDEQAQLDEWRAWCEQIARAAHGRAGVRAEVIEQHPDYGRPPLAPKAVLRFDGAAAAAGALDGRLRTGTPAIQPLRHADSLIFNPMSLLPGEADVIAKRLQAELR